MANKTLPQLPTSPLPLVGTEIVETVVGGESVSVTVQQVANIVLSPLVDPSQGAHMVAFSGDQPTVDDALKTRAKGNVGKTYNLIGAAVRRDTLISPNWQLVSDSAHIPINMSEPTDGVELQLNYSGSKIGTLVVGADERLAACGVVTGGSVAANLALLRMGAPCSFLVNLNDLAGTPITTDSRFFRLGRFGVSVAVSGLITLTHPQRQMNMMPIIQRYTDSSASELMFVDDIRASSAGVSTLWIKRSMKGRINWTGTAWAASNAPFLNADFSFPYDAPSGVLTVTHPAVVGNVQTLVTSYGLSTDSYHVEAFDGTGTTFKVRFRKLSDGSVPVSAPIPTNMGFTFDRGISAADKVPSGKLHVHLGHVQVDMNDVDFPLANIWPLAVMEA